MRDNWFEDPGPGSRTTAVVIWIGKEVVDLRSISPLSTCTYIMVVYTRPCSPIKTQGRIQDFGNRGVQVLNCQELKGGVLVHMGTTCFFFLSL